MPNFPFRVAFWALCLSFAMLVTLSIVNPKNMRTGLYAQSEKVAPVPDWVAVEQSYSPPPVENAEPTLAPGYEEGTGNIAKLEPVSDPTIEAEATSKPIMVAAASGDFRRDIGGLYPIAEAEPRPAIPSAPSISAEPQPTPIEEPARAVLVPDPGFPELADASPVNSEITDSEPEESHTGVLLEKMASIQDELAAIRAATTVAPTLSAVTIEQEASYTVTSGEDEDRWSFTFDQTELPEALRVLGEQIGWNVVIGQGVEGVVTAAFENADPEQAFAVLIKSYECSISRRGDYILIEKQSVLRN